jgi:hypothetical protein
MRAGRSTGREGLVATANLIGIGGVKIETFLG